VALLLSWQLAQRMLECVELQRNYGLLEGHSKLAMERINKTIGNLQGIISSVEPAIAEMERRKSTFGKYAR